MPMLLRKLFGILIGIGLAVCFGQDWGLRSRVLGDDMLQYALNFEDMR
jgi:hypothetical protein